MEAKELDVKEKTKSSKGKTKSKSKELKQQEKKPGGAQNKSILSNMTLDSMPKQQKQAGKIKMLKH